MKTLIFGYCVLWCWLSVIARASRRIFLTLKRSYDAEIGLVKGVIVFCIIAGLAGILVSFVAHDVLGLVGDL